METAPLVSILAGLAAMLGYGVSDFLGSILSKREDPIRLNIWYFALSAAILAVVAAIFYDPSQLITKKPLSLSSHLYSACLV
ncbi:MAG: hypothetical protein QW774_02140 [Candidatus Micrarchaeaceae archaeon]